MSPPAALKPRYNIAPTQAVAAIRLDPQGDRTVDMLRWGLVPRWAKDPSIGHRLINARGETVADKSVFRDALARRRCLILASGFYEWGQTPCGKRPFYISAKTGEIIAFAGLWERWQRNSRPPLESCVIITTASNPLLARVHDRMPVILPPDAQTAWLEAQTASDCLDLLKPIDEKSLRMWRVRRGVSDPRNDGTELVEPAALAPQ